MSDTIDAGRVRDITMDSLINTHDGEAAPVNTVYVEGIIHDYAFRPDKLVEHFAEIKSMLAQLPDTFREQSEGGGGGWSFLNACEDRHGVLWTGEHWTMEMLLCVAIGMGLAKWLLPKDMWSALPGGMPYVSITLEPKEVAK